MIQPGKGNYHLLLARSGPNSGGSLASVAPSGVVLWEREFEVFNDPPIWNQSGITHWLGGNFRSANRNDVYAVVRRNKSASEQGYLLDGLTGATIWSRKQGAQYNNCDDLINGLYTGPNPYQTAVLDFNADGLDDILDNANATYAVYQGSDGQVLINKWNVPWCSSAASDLLFADSFFEIEINAVVQAMNNGGSAQVLFAQNSTTMALLNTDASVVWKTPNYEGMPRETLQSPADLDGDGRFEIVVIGHCGTPGQEIRAYNSGDGSLRWSMSDSEICNWPAPRHPASGDIDGDGRDEVVFSHRNKIYALAEQQGQGVLRWRATIGDQSWGNQAGPVVIADVMNNGRPQLLINTSSARLYALGASADTIPDVPAASTYSGFWSNPERSGQGLQLVLREGVLGGAWYLYDETGDDLWVVFSGQLTGHRLTAPLLRFSGPAPGQPWDINQVNSTVVGSVTLTLNSTKNIYP